MIFTLFGLEQGYSVDEAKVIVKRELKYTYINNGVTFLKKTSEMNTKQLTEFIDKFRNWSVKEHNIYLPAPNESLEELENYIESQKQWT